MKQPSYVFIGLTVCLFAFASVAASENEAFQFVNNDTTTIITPYNISQLSEPGEQFNLVSGNSSSIIRVSNIEETDENGAVEEMENGAWPTANGTVTEIEKFETVTTESFSNESVNDFSNVTALPAIMDPGDDNDLYPAYGTTESAIILAGTFVLIAAVAYGAMFAWRRHLQVRYGTSDMLITEDAYDISDLRNFEI